MKVYLAGERALSFGEGWDRWVKRRLFSYHYHGAILGGVPSDQVVLSVQRGWDLFLDSGAYTAHTQGIELTVEAYAAFIHRTKDYWTCVSNLDNTHKQEKITYDNQKALESLGVKVQPVFHTREDPRWLVKYIDEGYDYIFIGGMVPETTAWLRDWLDRLWTKYLALPNGQPRVKVHGFGLTDQSLMFRYPWHSVDSTSWLMTGIFGGCVFMTPTGLRKVVFSATSPQRKEMDSWHYQSLPAPLQRQVDAWLEPFGVNAQQCSEHYSFRDMVNAATFQAMESMACAVFQYRSKGLFDA